MAVTVELSCDRCGAGYKADITETVSVTAIRDAAQRDGWQVARYGKRKDLCPRCVGASDPR